MNLLRLREEILDQWRLLKVKQQIRKEWERDEVRNIRMTWSLQGRVDVKNWEFLGSPMGACLYLRLSIILTQSMPTCSEEQHAHHGVND